MTRHFINVAINSNKGGMLTRIPKYPNFAKLSLSYQKEITDYVSQFPFYCDFNFTVLWWANLRDNFEVSNLNDNLVILFKDYVTSHPIYSFLGKNDVDHTVKTLIDKSKAEGYGNFLKLVPETCLETFTNKQNYEVIPDEDQFDYVYLLEDLTKLKGNKYAHHRHELHKFKDSFPDYNLEINKDIKDDEIKQYLDLADIWKANSSGKQDVFLWLKRLLEYRHAFSIEIARLNVGNVMAAFQIYEPLGSNVMSHLSCSNPNFKHANTGLVNAVAIHLSERGYTLVNKMEDLGLPNLRQAKLSWRPVQLLKKYIIREQE